MGQGASMEDEVVMDEEPTRVKSPVATTAGDGETSKKGKIDKKKYPV